VLGVAASVGEGVRVGRRGARPHGGLQGTLVVAGGRPVVSLLRPMAGGRGTLRLGLGRDLLGDGPMHPLTLPRQQVVVGHLLEESVAEAVARARDQHLALDGTPERRVERIVGQPGHRRQQLVVDRLSRSGRDGQHGASGIRQGPEAGQQDLAEGRREAAQVGPALRGEELLDEEGIAVGPLVDALRHGALGRRPQDRRRQRTRLGRVEAVEVDPLRPARAFQLRQPGPHRVPAVELVRSDRQRQADSLGAHGPDQVRDRIPGGRVGPVQVLDHEQQRLQVAQAVDHAQDGLEQPRLRPLGARIDADGRARDHARRRFRRERRHEPGELRTVGPDHLGSRLGRQVVGEPAQRLDQRAIREAALPDVGARAADDAHVQALREGGQLGDEPRLPDARLARDQQVPGLALDGRRQGLARAGQLAVAADHGRTDESAGHGHDDSHGSTPSWAVWSTTATGWVARRPTSR
jgi:hypothetical protein